MILSQGDAAHRFGERWQGYTATEYMVAMRDGARLHTWVLQPTAQDTDLPIILSRSPYGWSRPAEDPYYPGEIHGEDCIHSFMIDEGYIFIAQDERGRFGSEGVFEPNRPYHSQHAPDAVDDITDTHDTIDWALATLPRHNGRVGLNGNSYRAWHVMAGLVRPHPAVKAAAPSAAMSEGFIGDDFFHNGAFLLAQSLLFFTQHMDLYPFEAHGENPFTNNYDQLDIYRFFLDAGCIDNLRQYFPASSPLTDAILENDTYNAYWQAREMAPHLAVVAQCPVLHINNWDDVEDQYGTLLFYRVMKAQDRHNLVRIAAGPWQHGGWRYGEGSARGAFEFGSPTARYFREQVLGPFFCEHLKDQAPADLPGALMFDAGDNTWRAFEQWPPASTEITTLFFHGDGGLRDAPPQTAAASVSLHCDPANPVPFIPRPNTAGWRDDYRLEDQRFCSDRDDVLVFQSEPLTTPITLCGAALAELFFSSTGTDTDLVVKLIDAYPPDEQRPEGFHRLVLGDIFRTKFRHSYVHPTPLRPGEMESVSIPLLEQCYTFAVGHRIVAHIQSSWFPLFDRNPGVFTHIPSAAPEDFVAVDNSVYMAAEAASCLRLQTLVTHPDRQ